MNEQVNQVLENPNQILDLFPNIDLGESLIYLTGSIMEGFGNKTSDIDGFIIFSPNLYKRSRNNFLQEQEISVKQGKVFIKSFNIQNIDYDFIFLSWEQFIKAIDDFNKFDISRRDHALSIDRYTLDLLHRLKFAKSLINREQFEKIREKVQFEHLNAYMSIRGLGEYKDILEDLRGAFLSKDFGTAFFNARRLLDVSLTCFLATEGETNPSSKWLYRKLERYVNTNDDKDLYEKYMRLMNTAYSENTVEMHIQECLDFSDVLISRAETYLNKLKSE